MFLFSTASRLLMGCTQPSTYPTGTGAALLGDKVVGADHSPPPAAEIKHAWSFDSSQSHAFMECSLFKHRDNFQTVLQTP
jgi:hypothetical protein